MLPISKIAAILSAQTDKPRSTIERTLRNWVATGRLQPTRRIPRGQYVEAQFDAVGVCQARLMMAIASMMPVGFDVTTFDAATDHAVSEEIGNLNPVTGQTTTYSLAAAVAGTRKGEEWFFSVAMSHDLFPSGHWHKGSLKALDLSEIEAVAIIPFSRQCRPILAGLA